MKLEKIYNNGLRLKFAIGSYAPVCVFHRLDDDSYIIGKYCTFNGDSVEWCYGAYDIKNLNSAINLAIKKARA